MNFKSLFVTIILWMHDNENASGFLSGIVFGFICTNVITNIFLAVIITIILLVVFWGVLFPELKYLATEWGNENV